MKQQVSTIYRFDFNSENKNKIKFEGYIFFKTRFIIFIIPGTKIDHMNINIQPGFVFQGTINLIGLQMKCDLKILIPYALKLNIDMQPLTIAGGALQLARSAQDKLNGPKVYVAISKAEVSW